MPFNAGKTQHQAGDEMYNRYIPQADGSYLKRRIPDPPQPPKRPPVEVSPPPPQQPCEAQAPPPPPRQPPKQPSGSLESFFRQLLPRDFDTGDLIVVLLLLLMAADCREDQNTALLTLALYLFL